MPAQAALLIGPIAHAHREWEGLSSILTLKVHIHIHVLVCLLRIRNSQPALATTSYATANRGTTTTLLPSTGRTPRPRYADVTRLGLHRLMDSSLAPLTQSCSPPFPPRSSTFATTVRDTTISTWGSVRSGGSACPARPSPSTTLPRMWAYF